MIGHTRLRAAFAREMSAMYGREVPAYTTLVDVAAAVNADVAAREDLRLGSLERVTAERHGAIRVGTPAELSQVARVFAAFGMYPVGFYDLRDAAKSSVPVVSTAFRPTDPQELAANPFRMFTSLLVTDDRRFFSADLQRRLDAFLGTRTLFSPDLLALADRAVESGGLPDDAAADLVALATAAFELSGDPIDRGWYSELEKVSAVAADIGGTRSTHINHLTPRVLDIDELYQRMTAAGVTMIDEIQGPPAWKGPDVLLRQTSFRALAEPRRFVSGGQVSEGSLRVRFGEVEARGIALTRAGRDRYDQMLLEVDSRLTDGGVRADVARDVWTEQLPDSEIGLLDAGLAYFRYTAGDPAAVAADLSTAELVRRGALVATPIVYEDFLPRSAAGIFQSNLTDAGTSDRSVEGSARDVGWLSDVIGAQVAEPFDLYAEQQDESLEAAFDTLGVEP